MNHLTCCNYCLKDINFIFIDNIYRYSKRSNFICKLSFIEKDCGKIDVIE